MAIINNFFISGATVKVEITDASRLLAITNLSDFTVHFPNVDLSPPSEYHSLGFVIGCVHIKYILLLSFFLWVKVL